MKQTSTCERQFFTKKYGCLWIRKLLQKGIHPIGYYDLFWVWNFSGDNYWWCGHWTWRCIDVVELKMPVHERCQFMKDTIAWKLLVHGWPCCMEVPSVCKMAVLEIKNPSSEDNLTHFVLWLVSGLEFFRWQLLMMWTLLFSRWHLLISSCEAHGYSDMPIKLLWSGVSSIRFQVVCLIWES